MAIAAYDRPCVHGVAEYLENVANRRVLSNVEPGYLRTLLPPEAPQEGQPWEEIQKDIETKIMPGLTHWQSPKFMAFFSANSTYASILGELWSAALTAPAFNWQCSPAITELETIVLDWLAKIINLPSCFLSQGEGGGVIAGTASEATATTMIAARDRYVRRALEGLEVEERETKEWEVRSKLVAVGSDQSHSSIPKAAIIAGTRHRAVLTRREDGFAISGAGLRKHLEELRANGLHPYYLSLALGTTNTCAVDKFEEITEVMKEYPHIWTHVDAAYAGSALVLPEYQHLTEHFGSFDSFDINMHKWLLTSFDASCLYVRKRTDLTSALSITPEYLRNDYSSQGLVTDYRDWQIPLGRRFRSLKIWFVLRNYGVEGLRKHIRNCIDLGVLFHQLISSRKDVFQVFTGPNFALNTFTIVPPDTDTERFVPNGSTVEEGVHTAPAMAEGLVENVQPAVQVDYIKKANEITREVYELVNSKGEIFITSSIVDSNYIIRVVSAAERTEEKYIRMAFDVLVKAAEEVLRKREKV